MAFEDDLFGKPKRKNSGYPAGFKAIPSDGRIDHPELFDPALKQFSKAYRKGEPVFKDPADGVAWRAVRMRVIEHLLKIFAESDLRDSYVVRGSVLLKSWLGKAARVPHDIDWVVVPREMSLGQAESKALLVQTAELIRDKCDVYKVSFDFDSMVADDIWTYDRAPGKRLVLPWQTEHLPPGFVQMDFVFEEELWCPPIEIGLPHFEMGKTLLAASPEQSLAWKLLWLSTDSYAEGKDLYDAVLLAEKYPIDFKLLKTAYSDNGRLGDYQIREDLPMEWMVDWDDFHREYPDVLGTADDWKQKLCVALKSAFDSQLDEFQD